jgi:hypothetical protein
MRTLLPLEAALALVRVQSFLSVCFFCMITLATSSMNSGGSSFGGNLWKGYLFSRASPFTNREANRRGPTVVTTREVVGRHHGIEHTRGTLFGTSILRKPCMLRRTNKTKQNFAVGRKHSRDPVMPKLKVENGAVTIHYDLFGQGPEKVLFIMGFATNRSSWERQVDFFGNQHGDKYQVCIYDNRGMGAFFDFLRIVFFPPNSFPRTPWLTFFSVITRRQ